MTQSSDRWNPFKLIDTLSFFGEVPFVGNIRWLQQMFGATSDDPQAPEATDIKPKSQIVLLSEDGPDAEELKHIFQTQGITVRSQLLPVDSPLPDSASNRIVNAPVVVWKGVSNDEECLTAQIDELKPLPASEEYSLFDFRTSDTDELRELWGAVDDVVMGGVSESGMALLPGFARFSGMVSTANSGGFASIRTRNFNPPFNLQGWQGIRLVLRGDGQRYKTIVRNSSSWDSRAYCYSIDTVPDEWMVVDIPFSAFVATFRAKTQPAAPPLDPTMICSFQLMLSKFEYDGEKNPHFHPGSFSLDVRSFSTYRLTKQPKLIAIATSDEQAATYADMLASSQLSHTVLVKTDAAFTLKLSDAAGLD